jgi:hypothetical protein
LVSAYYKKWGEFSLVWGAGDFNEERHSTAIKLSFHGKRKNVKKKNMSPGFAIGKTASASMLITLLNFSVIKVSLPF